MTKNDWERRRNKRVRAIYFRDEGELAAVEEAARRLGIKPATLMREAVLRAARRQLRKAA